MDELISIIVPVYNVKKYLDRCLDAVIGQSYRNLEILVIDDGSADGSSEICDRYAGIDQRIRAFHTKNRGLSAARNLGLKHAKGRYYAFADSDDYMEPHMYERLYEGIRRSGCDVCACGHFVEGKDGILNTVAFEEESSCGTKKWLEDFLSPDRKSAGTPVWNKLFKAEVFEKIRFPVGHNYEDIWVFPEILENCGTLHMIPDILYHHQIHPDSITQDWSFGNFCDSLNSRRRIVSYTKKKYPELRGLADQYLFKTLVSHWYQLYLTDLDRTDAKRLQQKIRRKAIRLCRSRGMKNMTRFRRTANVLMIYAPFLAKYVYLGYIQRDRSDRRKETV